MVDFLYGSLFQEKPHNTKQGCKFCLYGVMVYYAVSFLFEFSVFNPAIVSLFYTGQI
ncbi:hypothetical protein Barb4_02446 [Bacteroidales bacterium Barb4]|nr:hypothetical protein Barb4_02446 [Bacteroidales bacterium Barb4]